jgi:DNA-binding MarR family transcriptional regulator
MLGARLRQAADAVHGAVRARLAVAGYDDLRPAHFALLQFPGPHDTRPTDLAGRVGLRKQALNPLINDLERMGYLQRTSAAQDRRTRILKLTPRGMDLMRIVRETLDDIDREMDARLGADAYRAFTAVLAEVHEAAASAGTSGV